MSSEQRKAVIKNADMSDVMQQDAVDVASKALSEYNIEKVGGCVRACGPLLRSMVMHVGAGVCSDACPRRLVGWLVGSVDVWLLLFVSVLFRSGRECVLCGAKGCWKFRLFSAFVFESLLEKLVVAVAVKTRPRTHNRPCANTHTGAIDRASEPRAVAAAQCCRKPTTWARG
jgi:hypothetical protein